MEYGVVLREAWRVTWRHKYLWLLGALAAEAGGLSLSAGGSVPNSYRWSVPLDEGGVGAFFLDHWVALLVIGLGVAVLSLGLAILSVICSAGLVAGVDNAFMRRPGASLSIAWRRGVRLFWKQLGLWLLTGLIALVGILALCLGFLPLILILALTHADMVAVVLCALAGLLLFIVVAIPLVAGLQIVSSFANRSLVLDGLGPFASLRAGFRLLLARPGPSVLVYILNLTLSVALGLVLAVAAIIVFLPLLLLTGAAEALPPVWILLAVVGLVIVAVMVALKAVTTTFFSAYWTIAWREIEGGETCRRTQRS
jgi:hypothetical protein